MQKTLDSDKTIYSQTPPQKVFHFTIFLCEFWAVQRIQCCFLKDTRSNCMREVKHVTILWTFEFASTDSIFLSSSSRCTEHFKSLCRVQISFVDIANMGKEVFWLREVHVKRLEHISLLRESITNAHNLVSVSYHMLWVGAHANEETSNWQGKDFDPTRLMPSYNDNKCTQSWQQFQLQDVDDVQ